MLYNIYGYQTCLGAKKVSSDFSYGLAMVLHARSQIRKEILRCKRSAQDTAVIQALIKVSQHKGGNNSKARRRLLY